MTSEPAKILYACPSVPHVWIQAHGLEPDNAIDHVSDSACSLPRRNTCPCVRAFLNRLSQNDAAGAIFSSRCDQMRRGYDLAQQLTNMPLFLLNTPARCQCKDCRDYYINELLRMSEFLIQCGSAGCKCDNLNSPRQASSPGPGKSNIRLALIGSGNMACDSFYKIIKDHNAEIVLNAPENLMGQLVPDTEYTNIEQLLEQLADRHFSYLPDVAHRPNNCFYDWLHRQIDQRNIDGIIVRYFVGCDIWHGEAARIKDEFDMPVLLLATQPSRGKIDAAQAQRIEAFLEMLQ